MKKLDYLDITVDCVYDDCISSIKDKEKYEQAKPEIVNSTNKFKLLAENNQLNEVPKGFTSNLEKEDLVNLYEYKLGRKNVSKYREILLNRKGVRLCPYCDIGSITTLDHILPKKEYPNLSVSPSNIVPACKDCNTNKGTMSPSINDEVINLYVDEVNSFRWLFVDFIDDEDIKIFPKYYILEEEKWESKQLFKKVTTLVNKLNLLDKFENQMVSNFFDTVKSFFRFSNLKNFDDLNQFWKNIKLTSEDYDKNYGYNYFLSALYYSMYQKRDILQILFNKYDNEFL